MGKLAAQLARYRELILLRNHFRNYFQVVPALTPDLVREAQMIRHDVYCSELGWEPISPDGLEKDEHDEKAIHCLLKAVRGQRYIGCVRLVLPVAEDKNCVLPIQVSCKGKLYEGHPDLEAISRGEVAEVSRLAILSDYRRRKHEKYRPVYLDEDDYSLKGKRRFPYIPVGLYIGMLYLAEYHGIKKLYILTEPLLAVHFSRLGGNLAAVGTAIEHRGKRKPYVMDVEDVLKNANFFLRPLMRTIRKDIYRQLK